MSVVQDRDSSGWSDLEGRKGKVDMWCQSCRTDTVQAGVTGSQEMCKEVDMLAIGFMEEI